MTWRLGREGPIETQRLVAGTGKSGQTRPEALKMRGRSDRQGRVSRWGGPGICTWLDLGEGCVSSGWIGGLGFTVQKRPVGGGK